MFTKRNTGLSYKHVTIIFIIALIFVVGLSQFPNTETKIQGAAVQNPAITCGASVPGLEYAQTYVRSANGVQNKYVCPSYNYPKTYCTSSSAAQSWFFCCPSPHDYLFSLLETDIPSGCVNYDVDFDSWPGRLLVSSPNGGTYSLDMGHPDFSPTDNCPDVYNLDQLDTDKDGIGDVCEVAAAPEAPAENPVKETTYSCVSGTPSDKVVIAAPLGKSEVICPAKKPWCNLDAVPTKGQCCAISATKDGHSCSLCIDAASIPVESEPVETPEEEPEEEPVVDSELTTTVASLDCSTYEIDKTYNSSIVLYGLSVTPKVSQSGDCGITMYELTSEKPKTVLVNSSGVVYKYLRIDSDITSLDLLSAKIFFGIPKSWLTDHNIDPASIVLKRYDATLGVWKLLTTQLLKTEELFVKYSADTSGFSYFAISGTEVVNVTATTSPEVSYDDTEEEVFAEDSKTETTNEPVATESSGSGWVILIIIVGVLLIGGIGFGVWYYYNKTPASSNEDELGEYLEKKE